MRTKISAMLAAKKKKREIQQINSNLGIMHVSHVGRDLKIMLKITIVMSSYKKENSKLGFCLTP